MFVPFADRLAQAVRFVCRVKGVPSVFATGSARRPVLSSKRPLRLMPSPDAHRHGKVGRACCCWTPPLFRTVSSARTRVFFSVFPLVYNRLLRPCMTCSRNQTCSIVLQKLRAVGTRVLGRLRGGVNIELEVDGVGDNIVWGAVLCSCRVFHNLTLWRLWP